MSGFFESIAALKARKPLLASWAIEGPRAGARALFAWEGNRYEEVCRDGAFRAEWAAGLQGNTFGQAGIVAREDARLFLEPLSAGRKLVVCGAGHVSMPVVRMGVMLNYEVSVIDDREAFAENARAAGAHHVICLPFERALDAIGGDPATAFVVMTREHAFDVDCLRLILKKPSAYVGMMGSHSRTEHIRRQLLAEGYDAESVRRVHMPIGLPIGSRTPEEIAVSIMAELIREMNAADSSEGFPPGMLEELVALENGAATDGPTAVLAMIVGKDGEAPRRPGTKMLVKADGHFTGTVGGGSAEARILKCAGDMLREGCRESRTARLTLEKGTMHCGGEITVFMQPL